MRRLRSSLACAVVLAGCGSSGGGDDPGPGTRETWVVASMTMPTNATLAQDQGFDLDGDGTVDNQLGAVISALTSAGSLDFQGGVNAAFDTGATVQLVETYTGASTSVALRTGTPAVAPCSGPEDVVCRRHLDGATAFTADAAADPPLAGAGTADAFSAGPGTAQLAVPLFGSAPLALPLVRARVSLERSGARLQGKVGGGVPQADVEAVLLPALAAWINEVVAADCPGGVCEPSSTGEQLLGIFDADEDGAVSVAEVQENPVVATLFRPDLDTDGNGAADALSLGVGVELVGAVF